MTTFKAGDCEREGGIFAVDKSVERRSAPLTVGHVNSFEVQLRSLHMRVSFVVLASVIALGLQLSSCNEVGPTPMDLPDTTSHGILWRPDSLGGPQSQLFGVWGTSETNVYAVGLLYGFGPGHLLVHYDGFQWTSIQDDSLTHWVAAGNLSGIHGTSDTNIFVVGTRFNLNVITGFVGRWNGRKWANISPTTSAQLVAIWVTNVSDVFVGGTDGTVFHYDGSTWTSIQTGTTLDVRQIIGLKSGEVFAVASEYYNSLAGSAILRLSSAGATTEHFFPIGAMFSLWGINSSHLYVAGEGIFVQSDAGSWLQLTTPFPAVTFFLLCGNNENNIVVAGAYGAVGHWSGRSWAFYPELYDRTSYASYIRGFTIGRYYFLVGSTGERALVNIGFRYGQ